MYDIAGLEFPAQVARDGVDRIEISVPAPEVDRALRHHRARKENIKRISDRLILWL